jgi:Fe-S-cluster containining protein
MEFSMQTYHVYPDALLGYDCIQCGGKCCKGHGFSVGPELVQIKKAYPQISVFVREKLNEKEYLINNAPGRCWFLDESSRCKIHSELDWLAKPITCRLFPANDIEQFDDLLVYSINLLCPVKPMLGPAPESNSSLLTHTEVERLARETSYSPRNASNRIFRTVTARMAFLKTEQIIRDQCKDQFYNDASLEECVQMQFETSSSESQVVLREYALRIDEVMQGLLGVSTLPSLPRPEEKLLIAITPIIRYHALKMLEDDYVRVASLVTRIVAVLYRYAAIWKSINSAQLDASTVDNLLKSFFPHLFFIASAEKVPEIGWNIVKAARTCPNGESRQFMRAVLLNMLQSDRSRKSLWELMRSQLQSIQPEERIVRIEKIKLTMRTLYQ